VTAQEYFQEALNMEAGDTLLIPCMDDKEQESVRVRMFQLRKTAHDESLLISRETIDGKQFVAMRKRGGSSGAFIVKKSGEVVQLTVPEAELTPAEKITRIVSVAVKDGYSFEELKSILGDTFDLEAVEKEYRLQTQE
jgi:hypothetical protein